MNTPSLAAYAAQQQRRAETLDALAHTAQAIDPTHAHALAELAERTRQGSFRVVLIGCFSSGKSTLLNALLGQPVLPVKVNPCTAVVTEVVWSDTPQVRVTWRDGRHEELTPVAFQERFQLHTDDPDSELADMAEVERATVGWPLPLLEHNVTLVDTPGLDDDPERTERTLNTLPQADAVLLVLNATRFLTQLERRTLAALRPMGLGTLFVPVAMTDLLGALTDDPVAAQQALTERAQAHLQPVLGDEWADRVFWLDGRAAVDAQWDRKGKVPRTDPSLPAAFAQFEEHLTHFLVHERGPARDARQRDALQAIGTVLNERRQLEQATWNTSAAALQERRQELQPRLDRLDAIARRVERLSSAFVRDQVTAVWDDLLAFLEETEAALPDALARIDVGGLAGLRLLVPSGRDAVQARLRAGLQTWLDERMDTWRTRCIPRLEDNLRQLYDELATQGEAFDAVRTDVLDVFTAGSVAVPETRPEGEPGSSERWFAVAMGAALLSPGAVAAGWAQGYEGVLKGAAGRVGARLGVLALGALLGPPGWAGLVVYVLADALLLAATGGTQLHRLRNSLASTLQGRLTGHAREQQDAIQAPLRQALAPIAAALTDAARADANAVSAQLDAVIASHAQSQVHATQRQAEWAAVDHALAMAQEAMQSE